MRFPTKALAGLGIIVLIATLSACGNSGSKTDRSASLTLRTYTVPDGQARDLSTTLSHVLGFSSDKNPVGRSWWAGSDQVLVLAPKHLQDSIAASLKEMASKNGSSAKPSGPVRLNAWVVVAYPGKGPADPSLKAIQRALNTFSDEMGPTHFVLGQYLTAVSDIGAHTVLNPSPTRNFRYVVKPASGGLSLNFSYSHHPVSVRLPNGVSVNGEVGLQGQVTLPFKQTVILGLISDQTAGSDSSATDQPIPATAGRATGSAAGMASVIHRLLVVRLTPAHRA